MRLLQEHLLRQGFLISLWFSDNFAVCESLAKLSISIVSPRQQLSGVIQYNSEVQATGSRPNHLDQRKQWINLSTELMARPVPPNARKRRPYILPAGPVTECAFAMRRIILPSCLDSVTSKHIFRCVNILT